MDYRSVQAEKEKAMMRYRRFRNIGKMWRLLEILVALAFLSWTSTRLPFTLKLAGHYIFQLYEYLFNPHINFVIGNAIIVVIVLISRKNYAGDNPAGSGDVFDQYVQNSVASVSDEVITTPSPPPAAEMEETAYDDKQIVVTENAATEPQCDAVTTAIEEATKQIKRFQRTQSDKALVRPRRHLRRSESVSMSADDERAITSFDTMDKLSRDDFNRTIEAVIEKHRRCLWAQKMDENKP